MADDTDGRTEAPKPEVAVAVTSRPADVPTENSTLASRAGKSAPAAKKVDAEDVEDKAVTSAKAPARKRAQSKA